MEELVAIAKLLKPRGLRGELVAELLTDFPERFENLETVVGVLPDGMRREFRIADAWFQKDRVILRFEGIDSIEKADTLRNTEICIPESESVELDEDEFFDWQLAGCEVRTIDGDSIGKVRKVMRTGGTENLVVEGEGKEYLIPFAGSICTEIDVAAKLIRVDLPEGLLEF